MGHETRATYVAVFWDVALCGVEEVTILYMDGERTDVILL